MSSNDVISLFHKTIFAIPTLVINDDEPKLYDRIRAINCKNQHMIEAINKIMVEKVESYIDENSTIRSIVNEFETLLTQFTTKSQFLDINKLFAMSVVKTLYPEEYQGLMDNQGVLWNIFNDSQSSQQTDSSSSQSSMSILLNDDHFKPILYLLRKHYFAADYKNYLPSLNRCTIHEDDQQLAYRLKTGQTLDFKQKIKSPKELIKELKPSDLSNGQGLINNIVSYLLENMASKQSEIRSHRYFSGLFSQSEENLSRFQHFLLQYFNHEQKNSTNLIKAMLLMNQHLLIQCITNDKSNDGVQSSLLTKVLPILVAQKNNNMSAMVNASIASLKDIKPIYQLAQTEPIIWTWLKNNQIKFNNLLLSSCTQEIAFTLINDSMYQLNTHMLGVLLAYTAEQQPGVLSEISYSALCSCGHDRLIDQINDNLNEFVEKILLPKPQIKETKSYLLKLIHSPKLKANNKVLLLKRSGEKLVSIRETLECSLSLSAQLLENNLVEASWDNILCVFNLNQTLTINSILIKFISVPDHAEKLSLQALPSNASTDRLLVALVHTKQIDDQIIDQLLAAFPATLFQNFDPELISTNRIKLMRQHPSCQFSLKSLDWLSQNENRFSVDNTYYYLLRFWNKYQSKAENTASLTINTIIKLLTGSEIQISDKLWLCNLLNNENEVDNRILTAMLHPIKSISPDKFSLRIRFNRLSVLLEVAENQSDKIRILSQQVKYLFRYEVLTLLSRLDIEGTGHLMKEGSQFSLSLNKENIELVNALRWGYHIEAVIDKKQQKVRAYIKKSTSRTLN